MLSISFLYLEPIFQDTLRDRHAEKSKFLFPRKKLERRKDDSFWRKSGLSSNNEGSNSSKEKLILFNFIFCVYVMIEFHFFLKKNS